MTLLSNVLFTKVSLSEKPFDLLLNVDGSLLRKKNLVVHLTNCIAINI
jgi:hypothetical protein